MTDAIEAGDADRARKLAARHIADTQTTSARATRNSGSWRSRRKRWPVVNAERCCVRTALITGGSGGIGKDAAASSLNSATTSSSPRDARNPCAPRPRTSARAMSSPTPAIPDKFAPAVEAAGEIDLLVHASGILGGTYARKQTFDQWRATISANLDSCFVVTSAALPRMKAGSRFVFISSSAAHEPMMARTAYSASKAGMNAFAGALAQEVDRDGINVHIVTPGPVETDMLHRCAVRDVCDPGRRRRRGGRVAGHPRPVGRPAGDQAARHHPWALGATPGGPAGGRAAHHAYQVISACWVALSATPHAEIASQSAIWTCDSIW